MGLVNFSRFHAPTYISRVNCAEIAGEWRQTNMWMWMWILNLYSAISWSISIALSTLVFREKYSLQTTPKAAAAEQYNLRIKFSALNVDFNSLFPTSKYSPLYGASNWVPHQNWKIIEDRHEHSPYLNVLQLSTDAVARLMSISWDFFFVLGDKHGHNALAENFPKGAVRGRCVKSSMEWEGVKN